MPLYKLWCNEYQYERCTIPGVFIDMQNIFAKTQYMEEPFYAKTQYIVAHFYAKTQYIEEHFYAKTQYIEEHFETKVLP